MAPGSLGWIEHADPMQTPRVRSDFGRVCMASGVAFQPLRQSDDVAALLELEAVLPEEVPQRNDLLARGLSQPPPLGTGVPLPYGAFAAGQLSERLRQGPRWTGLVEALRLVWHQILRQLRPGQPPLLLLVSPAKQCACCGGTLVVDPRPSWPPVYTTTGPCEGRLYSKNCTACGARHGLTFAVCEPRRGTGSDEKKTWTPIPGAVNGAFFQYNETVYEREVLRRFDVQTTFSHTAVMTYATEYAALFGRKGCFGRLVFSRVWLVYTLLNWLDEMDQIRPPPHALRLRLTRTLRRDEVKSDLDATLESWTPLIRGYFISKWAVNHRTVCALRRPDGSTCSCWIIDGHMKARRVVCDNTKARFLDIPGLGQVVLGCLHTPMRKSRFCASCGEGAAFCVVPEGFAEAAEKGGKRMHAAVDSTSAAGGKQAESSGDEDASASAAAVDSMECEECDEQDEPPALVHSEADSEAEDEPPNEYEELPDKAKKQYLVSGALARRKVLKGNADTTCRSLPATWKSCQKKKHMEYELTFVGYQGSWWICECDIGDASLARAKVEVASLEVAAAGGAEAVAAAKVANADALRAARAAKRLDETAEWQAFQKAKAEQEAERLARERALQADPRHARISGRTRGGRAAASSEPPPDEPPHAGEYAADPERKDGGDFDSAEGSSLAAAFTEVVCKNLKENQYADMKKRTTAGVLATVSSCGLFLSTDELAVAESLKQVHQSMHSMLSTPGIEPPKVLAYDDACHLHRFWHRRKESSPWINWLLSKITLVVDRFHFRNHDADYCRKYVDPKKCAALRQDDNTEAAEQAFAWLARSKHLFRTMNESRFLFTILRLMHLRNRYTAGMPFHHAD